MHIDKHAPVHNLKVVLQETGLKADTVRAWERRYGLPRPDRSAGGHRLYSYYDIEIVKWLLARQDEGMRISQAVDLFKRLENEGQDPLEAMSYAAAPPAVEPVAVIAEGDVIAQLRAAWVTACMDFNEQAADQAVTQASGMYPPEAVAIELLQKGLSEIGQVWYAGDATVQQEHFASNLAMRRLETLISSTPPPTRPERIIVACPPEERHTFSPLLITYLLKRRGWNVIYLGADVPEMKLDEMVEQTNPQLVILAAQLLFTAASLRDMAQALSEQNITVGYGGRIFNIVPQLQAHIPGHFLGETVDSIPVTVEQLLSTTPATSHVDAVTEVYQAAYTHFVDQQGLIEAEIWQQLEGMGMEYAHINEANTNMQRNIAAALSLGDINLLGGDMHWIEGLLSNYGLIEALPHYVTPYALLLEYIKAYHLAAQKHLEEGPVTEWLISVLNAEQSS